ncbi:hypothetical protein [Streptomyces sp. CC224B]|uniref:hypothetical protein n=1 Tax=Streptomyces sp. CC224B TaxID=3044571 RepID=UPI0024A87301|nr:hypothetical protein [Streptomyces sp. CC224B]
MPVSPHRRLAQFGALAALTAGTALAVAPQAAADTNTGTAKSTMLCNIVLLSLGSTSDGCSNVQVNGQNVAKKNTLNHALVDYTKAETVTALLP